MSPRPRVLSIVRGADPGAPRVADPALEATSFALADDVDVTVLLKAQGVELAVDGACCQAVRLRGVEVPVAEPWLDLRGMIASGVRVLAVLEDVEARGLAHGMLLAGVGLIAEAELAGLILAHDWTLTTSG